MLQSASQSDLKESGRQLVLSAHKMFLALSIPGVLVSGLVLMFGGKWKTILIGLVLLLFAAPCWMLAMRLSALLVVRCLVVNPRPLNRSSIAALAGAASTYDATVLLIWINVFHWLLADHLIVGSWALSLWCLSTAVLPLIGLEIALPNRLKHVQDSRGSLYWVGFVASVAAGILVSGMYGLTAQQLVAFELVVGVWFIASSTIQALKTGRVSTHFWGLAVNTWPHRLVA